jgi:hypothetical protein
MPNPIEIEEAFQQTIGDMDGAQSFRFIYSRFFDFTERLEGDFLKYQSYLVQLLDLLPVFTLPITWSGMNPNELSGYADSIEDISRLIGSEPPAEAVKRLRQAAFLQYICVSDPERAILELKKVTGSNPLGEFLPTQPGETTRENLLQIKSWLQELLSGKQVSKKTSKVLNQCVRDITQITEEREFSVSIPVVERNSRGEGGEQPYLSGRLRILTLHDSGESKEEDQIVRSFPITGAEPVSSLKKTAVSAIPRKLAEERYPFLKGKYYRAHLHYEVNGANHEGESSDVAISALWYSLLIEKTETREHVRISSQAAITGMLNDEGQIAEVDRDGVEWKTQAAFFSWMETLVVPMSQYTLFDRCLSQWKKKYPNKKCTLIGIESVEDIFFDRRLTQFEVEGRIRYGLNKIKKEKFKSVGLPLIVLLMLIIARLMYGPVDQRPASISFVDNFIEIKNSDGFTLHVLLHRDVEDTYISGQAELLDVNSDSYKDLIYDYTSEDINNGNPLLRAWSTRGDSLLWQSAINLNYSYPRQLIPEFTNLRVIEIDIGQSVSGPRVVVSARSTQYFQGVILIYDAENGELLSEYVNAGIITDMLITDRNGDDISEVVFVGINNAYWNSFIAEIDIDEGHGYSPSTADYIPEGIQKANERMYALLPKSLVGEYLTPIDKYNFARDVRYDQQRLEYLAIVQEGRRYFDGDLFGVDVLYHFDHSFKPTGIGTSDAYDVAARDFYREGKIPIEPNFDYFEALQDSILYWNGDEFVTTQKYFSDEKE